MPQEATSRVGENPINKSWIACHVYYHQNLDQVILDFVRPLVARLVAEGKVEAFFFVRYSLGGPHIRVRFRVARRSFKEYVSSVASELAHQFLRRKPSTQSISIDRIQALNDYILAHDVHEDDDAVYPDNHFRFAPFCPELSRYGDGKLYNYSLDFFAISSVASMAALARGQEFDRSTQLAQGFRLVFQQALGFSRDWSELVDIVRYGVDSWGESMPKIMSKAEALVNSGRGEFDKLVSVSMAEIASREVVSSRGLSPSTLLFEGSKRLSKELRSVDRHKRAGIGGSQLHMTASRLGFSVPEEVYLSRLLSLVLSGSSNSNKEAILRAIGQGFSGQSMRHLRSEALRMIRAD